ncbi:MAG: hypothetical protein MI864_08760 [Pseudomonadales bacterium]|nr:hypothetical protein [Pseudomonadales bacterium]
MKSTLVKWACIAMLSFSPVQQVSGIRGGQPVTDASESRIRALWSQHSALQSNRNS